MDRITDLEQKLHRISAQEEQFKKEKEDIAREVGVQIGEINDRIAELQNELGSLFEQRRKLEEFLDQQHLHQRAGKIRKTRQVILDYLAEHPSSSAPQISRDTEIPEPTVQAQLSRAMEDGQVTRSGKRPFVYKLSGSGDSASTVGTGTEKIFLHNEIKAILLESDKEWMTTKELAALVNERQRYRKKDGSEMTAWQIHGRAKNYPNLFERDKQLVRLLPGAKEA